MFVPDHMKDDSYWSKRKKNNEAAKMSREAKRRKENQIVMRAAFLESENTGIKSQLRKYTSDNDVIRNDLQILAKRLGNYQNQNGGAQNYNNASTLTTLGNQIV